MSTSDLLMCTHRQGHLHTHVHTHTTHMKKEKEGGREGGREKGRRWREWVEKGLWVGKWNLWLSSKTQIWMLASLEGRRPGDHPAKCTAWHERGHSGFMWSRATESQQQVLTEFCCWVKDRPEAKPRAGAHGRVGREVGLGGGQRVKGFWNCWILLSRC